MAIYKENDPLFPSATSPEEDKPLYEERATDYKAIGQVFENLKKMYPTDLEGSTLEDFTKRFTTDNSYRSVVHQYLRDGGDESFLTPEALEDYTGTYVNPANLQRQIVERRMQEAYDNKDWWDKTLYNIDNLFSKNSAIRFGEWALHATETLPDDLTKSFVTASSDNMMIDPWGARGVGILKSTSSEAASFVNESQELNKKAAQAAIFDLTEKNIALEAEVEKSIRAHTTPVAPDTWSNDIVRSIGNMVPMLATAFLTKKLEVLAGVAPLNWSMKIGKWTLPLFKDAGIYTAVTSSAMGALMESSSMMNESYTAMRERGYSDEEIMSAMKFANLAGVPIGMIDAVPMADIGSRILGKQMIEKFGKDGAVELTKKSLLGWAKESGKDLLEEMGSEALQEFSQTSLEQVVAGINYGKEFSIEESLYGGALGSMSSLFMSAPGKLVGKAFTETAAKLGSNSILDAKRVAFFDFVNPVVAIKENGVATSIAADLAFGTVDLSEVKSPKSKLFGKALSVVSAVGKDINSKATNTVEWALDVGNQRRSIYQDLKGLFGFLSPDPAAKMDAETSNNAAKTEVEIIKRGTKDATLTIAAETGVNNEEAIHIAMLGLDNAIDSNPNINEEQKSTLKNDVEKVRLNVSEELANVYKSRLHSFLNKQNALNEKVGNTIFTAKDGQAVRFVKSPVVDINGYTEENTKLFAEQADLAIVQGILAEPSLDASKKAIILPKFIERLIASRETTSMPEIDEVSALGRKKYSKANANTMPALLNVEGKSIIPDYVLQDGKVVMAEEFTKIDPYFLNTKNKPTKEQIAASNGRVAGNSKEILQSKNLKGTSLTDMLSKEKQAFDAREESIKQSQGEIIFIDKNDNITFLQEKTPEEIKAVPIGDKQSKKETVNDWVSINNPDPRYEVLRSLRIATNPEITFVTNENTTFDGPGIYNRKAGKNGNGLITINTDQITSKDHAFHVLLEEMLHHATLNQLYNDNLFFQSTKYLLMKARAAYGLLTPEETDMMKGLGMSVEKTNTLEGLSDEHKQRILYRLSGPNAIAEFIVGGFSDPIFADALRKVSTVGSKSKLSTIFHALMELIGKIVNSRTLLDDVNDLLASKVKLPSVRNEGGLKLSESFTVKASMQSALGKTFNTIAERYGLKVISVEQPDLKQVGAAYDMLDEIAEDYGWKKGGVDGEPVWTSPDGETTLTFKEAGILIGDYYRVIGASQVLATGTIVNGELKTENMWGIEFARRAPNFGLPRSLFVYDPLATNRNGELGTWFKDEDGEFKEAVDPVQMVVSSSNNVVCLFSDMYDDKVDNKNSGHSSKTGVSILNAFSDVFLRTYLQDVQNINGGENTEEIKSIEEVYTQFKKDYPNLLDQPPGLTAVYLDAQPEFRRMLKSKFPVVFANVDVNDSMTMTEMLRNPYISTAFQLNSDPKIQQKMAVQFLEKAVVADKLQTDPAMNEIIDNRAIEKMENEVPTEDRYVANLEERAIVANKLYADVKTIASFYIPNISKSQNPYIELQKRPEFSDENGFSADKFVKESLKNSSITGLLALQFEKERGSLRSVKFDEYVRKKLVAFATAIQSKIEVPQIGAEFDVDGIVIANLSSNYDDPVNNSQKQNVVDKSQIWEYFEQMNNILFNGKLSMFQVAYLFDKAKQENHSIADSGKVNTLRSMMMNQGYIYLGMMSDKDTSFAIKDNGGFKSSKFISIVTDFIYNKITDGKGMAWLQSGLPEALATAAKYPMLFAINRDANRKPVSFSIIPGAIETIAIRGLLTDMQKGFSLAEIAGNPKAYFGNKRNAFLSDFIKDNKRANMVAPQRIGAITEETIRLAERNPNIFEVVRNGDKVTDILVKMMIMENPPKGHPLYSLFMNSQNIERGDGGGMYALNSPFEQMYSETFGDMGLNGIKYFTVAKQGEPGQFQKACLHAYSSDDVIGKLLSAWNVGYILFDGAEKIQELPRTSAETIHSILNANGDEQVESIRKSGKIIKQSITRMHQVFVNKSVHESGAGLRSAATIVMQMKLYDLIENLDINAQNEIASYTGADMFEYLRNQIGTSTNPVVEKITKILKPFLQLPAEKELMELQSLLKNATGENKNILIREINSVKEKVEEQFLERSKMLEVLFKHKVFSGIPNALQGQTMKRLFNLETTSAKVILQPDLGSLAESHHNSTKESIYNSIYSLPTDHPVLQMIIPHEATRELVCSISEVEKEIRQNKQKRANAGRMERFTLDKNLRELHEELAALKQSLPDSYRLSRLELGEQLENDSFDKSVLHLSAKDEKVWDELQTSLDKAKKELGKIHEEKGTESTEYWDTNRSIAKIRTDMYKMVMKSNYNYAHRNNPIVQKYVEQQMSQIFDTYKVMEGDKEVTKYGFLKSGHTMVSSETMNALGISPGDEVIYIVVPTDSPAAIGVVRAWPMSDKNAAQNKISLNSEDIQGRGGRDFDVDGIFLFPKSENFTDKEFESAKDHIRKEANKRGFESRINKTIAKELGREINSEEFFEKKSRDTIFVEFMQKIFGEIPAEKKSGIENLSLIEEMYKQSIGQIASLARQQSFLAASNVKTKIEAYSPELQASIPLTLKYNHDANLIDAVNMILKNHTVDFPNNISRIKYGSYDMNEMSRMIHRFYAGQTVVTDDFSTVYSIARAAEFENFLFSFAAKLVKGEENPFLKDSGAVNFIEYVRQQQRIIALLKEDSPKARAELLFMYEQNLRGRNLREGDKVKRVKIAMQWLKNFDYKSFTPENHTTLNQIIGFNTEEVAKSLKSNDLVREINSEHGALRTMIASYGLTEIYKKAYTSWKKDSSEFSGMTFNPIDDNVGAASLLWALHINDARERYIARKKMEKKTSGSNEDVSFTESEKDMFDLMKDARNTIVDIMVAPTEYDKAPSMRRRNYMSAIAPMVLSKEYIQIGEDVQRNVLYKLDTAANRPQLGFIINDDGKTFVWYKDAKNNAEGTYAYNELPKVIKSEFVGTGLNKDNVFAQFDNGKSIWDDYRKSDPELWQKQGIVEKDLSAGIMNRKLFLKLFEPKNNLTITERTARAQQYVTRITDGFIEKESRLFPSEPDKIQAKAALWLSMAGIRHSDVSSTFKSATGGTKTSPIVNSASRGAHPSNGFFYSLVSENDFKGLSGKTFLENYLTSYVHSYANEDMRFPSEQNNRFWAFNFGDRPQGDTFGTWTPGLGDIVQFLTNKYSSWEAMDKDGDAIMDKVIAFAKAKDIDGLSKYVEELVNQTFMLSYDVLIDPHSSEIMKDISNYNNGSMSLADLENKYKNTLASEETHKLLFDKHVTPENGKDPHFQWLIGYAHCLVKQAKQITTVNEKDYRGKVISFWTGVWTMQHAAGYGKDVFNSVMKNIAIGLNVDGKVIGVDGHRVGSMLLTTARPEDSSYIQSFNTIQLFKYLQQQTSGYTENVFREIELILNKITQIGNQYDNAAENQQGFSSGKATKEEIEKFGTGRGKNATFTKVFMKEEALRHIYDLIDKNEFYFVHGVKFFEENGKMYAAKKEAIEQFGTNIPEEHRIYSGERLSEVLGFATRDENGLIVPDGSKQSNKWMHRVISSAWGYQKIYSIMIPKMYQSMLDYNSAIRDKLLEAGNYQAALETQYIVARYQNFLDAVQPMKFSYLPHSYGANQALALHKMKQIQDKYGKLIEERDQVKNSNPHSPIARKDNRQLWKEASTSIGHSFTGIELEGGGGHIMDNLEGRRILLGNSYDRSSVDMHTRYFSRLKDQMTNDTAFTQSRYSSMFLGHESEYVKTIMNQWFQMRSANPLLHMININPKEVKKGDRIYGTFQVYRDFQVGDKLVFRKTAAKLYGKVADVANGIMTLKSSSTDVRSEMSQKVFEEMSKTINKFLQNFAFVRVRGEYFKNIKVQSNQASMLRRLGWQGQWPANKYEADLAIAIQMQELAGQNNFSAFSVVEQTEFIDHYKSTMQETIDYIDSELGAINGIDPQTILDVADNNKRNHQRQQLMEFRDELSMNLVQIDDLAKHLSSSGANSGSILQMLSDMYIDSVAGRAYLPAILSARTKGESLIDSSKSGIIEAEEVEELKKNFGNNDDFWKILRNAGSTFDIPVDHLANAVTPDNEFQMQKKAFKEIIAGMKSMIRQTSTSYRSHELSKASDLQKFQRDGVIEGLQRWIDENRLEDNHDWMNTLNRIAKQSMLKLFYFMRGYQTYMQLGGGFIGGFGSMTRNLFSGLWIIISTTGRIALNLASLPWSKADSGFNFDKKKIAEAFKNGDFSTLNPDQKALSDAWGQLGIFDGAKIAEAVAMGDFKNIDYYSGTGGRTQQIKRAWRVMKDSTAYGAFYENIQMMYEEYENPFTKADIAEMRKSGLSYDDIEKKKKERRNQLYLKTIQAYAEWENTKQEKLYLSGQAIDTNLTNQNLDEVIAKIFESRLQTEVVNRAEQYGIINGSKRGQAHRQFVGVIGNILADHMMSIFQLPERYLRQLNTWAQMQSAINLGVTNPEVLTQTAMNGIRRQALYDAPNKQLSSHTKLGGLRNKFALFGVYQAEEWGRLLDEVYYANAYGARKEIVDPRRPSAHFFTPSWKQLLHSTYLDEAGIIHSNSFGIIARHFIFSGVAKIFGSLMKLAGLSVGFPVFFEPVTKSVFGIFALLAGDDDDEEKAFKKRRDLGVKIGVQKDVVPRQFIQFVRDATFFAGWLNKLPVEATFAFANKKDNESYLDLALNPFNKNKHNPFLGSRVGNMLLNYYYLGLTLMTPNNEIDIETKYYGGATSEARRDKFLAQFSGIPYHMNENTFKEAMGIGSKHGGQTRRSNHGM